MNVTDPLTLTLSTVTFHVGMGSTPRAFKAVRLEDEPEPSRSGAQIKTPRYGEPTPFDLDDLESGVHPIDPKALEQELGAKMWSSFREKDYRMALLAANEILATNPAHAVALACVEECRRNLIRDIELTSVPVIVGSPESIRSARLDNREGFLLSQVDGRLSVDELLDVSGMDHGEALTVIAKLVTLGLVAMR
jgi:hypothetical protein